MQPFQKTSSNASRYQSFNEANRSTWLPLTLLNNRSRLSLKHSLLHFGGLPLGLRWLTYAIRTCLGGAETCPRMTFPRYWRARMWPASIEIEGVSSSSKWSTFAQIPCTMQITELSLLHSKTAMWIICLMWSRQTWMQVLLHFLTCGGKESSSQEDKRNGYYLDLWGTS